MRFGEHVEKGLLIVFFLLGIVVMVAAYRLPYPLFRTIGGNPGLFPWALGLLVSVLSALLLLGGLLKRSTGSSRRDGCEGFRDTAPFALLGISILFTMLLPIFGFILGSLLWMVAMLILFRPEKALVFVMVMTFLIALTYIAFRLYLPVPLPSGWLFEWLL